jgi:hypothetical protein
MTEPKGEDLYRDKRIEFPFYRTLDIDYRPEDLIFHSNLLQSTAIEQCKYPDDSTQHFPSNPFSPALVAPCFSSPKPSLGTYHSCHRQSKFPLIPSQKLTLPPDVTTINVTLKADFSKVPRSEFKEMTSPDGKPFVKIEYKLVLQTIAANHEFYAEINGMKVGTVTPDYH